MAGGISHNRPDSGACRLTDFGGTSTGRGTRRRGNPGRLGNQANRPGSLTPGFGRSPDRNGPKGRIKARRSGARASAQATNRREPDRDRWTKRGLGRADDQRPGVRQDTADLPQGLPRRSRRQGPKPQRPSPNPDLARGRSKPVRRGASSPRSISAPSPPHRRRRWGGGAARIRAVTEGATPAQPTGRPPFSSPFAEQMGRRTPAFPSPPTPPKPRPCATTGIAVSDRTAGPF